MSSSKKNRIPIESLRRSSRTEILKQKAEILKNEELEKQKLEKEKHETLQQLKPVKPLVPKKKKKKKKKFKQNTNFQTPFSFPDVYKPDDDNDDGFIPEDTAFGTYPINPPKQFNELEVWKQYQSIGDNDDGFIPDDDTAAGGGGGGIEPNVIIEDPAGQILQKRKLSENWKRDKYGRKLSKKKRRKAERKWLKKLFHESVIIAEPQESETNSQTDASSMEQTVTVSTTDSLGVDEGPMPMIVTTEGYPSSGLNGETEVPLPFNLVKSNSVVDESIPSSYQDKNNEIIEENIVDTPRYPEIVSVNGNSFPWEDGIDSLQSTEDSIQNFTPTQNALEDAPTEEERKLQEEMEQLRATSGLSKLAFSNHLLKLHKHFCKGCNTPLKEQSTSKEPQLTTNFIDLTSGKTETDDRKKRYKMELSLPEGTTILVTNMVHRDSSLPKVIFMLKKTSVNGVTQDSPLLMGCSNESGKPGGQTENNRLLEKELREITKNFLRVHSGSGDIVSNVNEGLTVPKALEFSME